MVVTELDMSEPAAERLIEECKEAGLALTFLPQHYGLLGPGIELNRLAELPVLDFRFSDPSRSTVAMKRAMDVVVSGALLLAALAAAGWRSRSRSCSTPAARSSSASAAPGWKASRSTMLKFRTMVADAEERLRRAGRPREARAAGLQDPSTTRG